MKKIMQHRRLRYIGLDVHRATIAVAISEEEGSPNSYGTIANDPAAVRKSRFIRGVQRRDSCDLGCEPAGFRALILLFLQIDVVDDLGDGGQRRISDCRVAQQDLERT